jgi:zinc protease
MLAAVLGGSTTTSVLNRKLNFEQGVALQAWASYSGTARDYGTFSVGLAPVEGVTLEQAEAALDSALSEFMRDGVDLQQFERVRRQIRASEIYALDSAQGRARQYGVGLSVGLTIADIDGWIAALDAVTPEQVMQAAELLRTRRAAVTGYMSRPATPEVTQ